MGTSKNFFFITHPDPRTNARLNDAVAHGGIRTVPLFRQRGR
jgi:hypothetical protein